MIEQEPARIEHKEENKALPPDEERDTGRIAGIFS
jgi:hypothetical protein